MIKTSTIGNLNCTFGKDHLPMLTYFKEIIYPSFKNNFKVETEFRKIGDDIYFFDEVKIIKQKDRYLLRGLLVKKTKLVVESEYKEGKIKFEHKSYDAAPVSIFSIYLDNHKFIYTPNQKGSPNILAFSATLKWYVKEGIKEWNKKNEKKNKIPQASINVIDIPDKVTIKEKLSKVEKIKKLTFKMVNPNGDIETGEVFESLLGMLEMTEGNSLSVSNTNPTNMENTTKLIAESQGYADFKLAVKFIDGGEGNLNNTAMSEKISIDIPKNTTIDVVGNIAADTLKDNKILKTVAPENKEIYNKYKAEIETVYQ